MASVCYRITGILRYNGKETMYVIQALANTHSKKEIGIFTKPEAINLFKSTEKPCFSNFSVGKAYGKDYIKINKGDTNSITIDLGKNIEDILDIEKIVYEPDDELIMWNNTWKYLTSSSGLGALKNKRVLPEGYFAKISKCDI